jgi:repressor LexA
MAEELTPRQAEILAALRKLQDRHGRPPTRAEICEHLGFRSPNAAEEHLRTLARKGAIELVPGAARGIRLKQVGVPVVGRVAAGSPILAQENIDTRIRLDPHWFRPRADYFLRVQGMSMRDVGILDGDLLAVHKTPSAENGQIVVARLTDEVTVKRLQRKGNRVRLLPENPDFQPIEVDPREDFFAIEGVAVGVLRNGFPL